MVYQTLFTSKPIAECVDVLNQGTRGGLALGLPPPIVPLAVIAGKADERGFWIRTRTFAGSSVMISGRWKTAGNGTRVSVWVLPEFMWLIAILSLIAAAIFIASGWPRIALLVVALAFAVLFWRSSVTELRRLRRYLDDNLSTVESQPLETNVPD
jgi:hypothetical protein